MGPAAEASLDLGSIRKQALQTIAEKGDPTSELGPRYIDLRRYVFSTHPHSRQLPPSILSHLAPFLHLRECTCDAHGENLLWGHSKRTLTCSHHRSLFDRAHLLPTRQPTHPSTTCHDMPSAAALPHHLHQNRLSSRSGSVGPVLLPAPRYSSVSSSPCVPRPRSLPGRQILDLGTR
jgi:hypothetical protein